MKGKRVNSNQKGKRGEREWANLCKEHGYNVRRSQQYAGGTEESADCVGLPYIHQEVKYGYDMTVEQIREFICQAMQDSVFYNDINKMVLPIVAHKKTYGKWFVSMETTDFLHMNMVILHDGCAVESPTYELTYITMPADDWFKIYKEFESSMRIAEG